ncbi:MAG: Rid family detoxifying hydrolase [Spirochaetaceae bacterium]|nr:Rid family detoxifying hydrolase [Spirochaetaceae bacterium]
MSKEIISVPGVPAPIGPYSAAIRSGNTLFLSGQLGLDSVTGELVSSSIIMQAQQAMANIRLLLRAAGADMDAIVKTTIYLTDINNFPSVNEVYASCFTGSYPARTTVEVSRLPKGALVEIEAVAAL